MKVTILGVGGIGLGLGALSSGKGVELCLWSRSLDRVQASGQEQQFSCTGAIEGEFRAKVHWSMDEAIKDADVVILTVPGHGHKNVIDQLVPFLTSRHVVIINSHMSLSSLYLSQRLKERGTRCLIVTWATTPVTGARTALEHVKVAAIRRQIMTSAIPADHTGVAIGICSELFGDIFLAGSDVLATTLANVNPMNHLPMVLCNITRMEHGENWGAYYGISGVVGHLLEALDEERLELAAAFGLSLHTDREHLHRSFNLPLGAIGEMTMEQNRRGNGTPAGPKTLDHRYVNEDIPFGIVPVLAIARVAGVEMPLHDAGLKIVSALYARNFRSENDILPSLCIEDLDMLDFHDLARTGYAS